MRVIHYKRFKPESVRFSKLHKIMNGSLNGSNVVSMNVSGKKIYLQTPEFRVLDDILEATSYTYLYGHTPHFYIQFFVGTDNPKAMAFRKKIMQLEDLVIKTVAENSEEWLGKKISEADARRAHSGLFRTPNKNIPSNMLMLIEALKDEKGEFIPKAYNSNQKEVELDTIFNSNVTCILEISHIWFNNNRFGVKMYIKQIRKNTDTYSFINANSNSNNNYSSKSKNVRPLSKSEQLKKIKNRLQNASLQNFNTTVSRIKNNLPSNIYRTDVNNIVRKMKPSIFNKIFNKLNNNPLNNRVSIMNTMKNHDLINKSDINKLKNKMNKHSANARAKIEEARKAKEEAEVIRKMREAGIRRGKAEYNIKAKAKANRKAKKEANKNAKAKANRKAKKEANKNAKAKANRKAKK